MSAHFRSFVCSRCLLVYDVILVVINSPWSLSKTTANAIPILKNELSSTRLSYGTAVPVKWAGLRRIIDSSSVRISILDSFPIDFVPRGLHSSIEALQREAIFSGYVRTKKCCPTKEANAIVTANSIARGDPGTTLWNPNGKPKRSCRTDRRFQYHNS